MRRQVGFLKIGRLEGFEEIAPVVGKDFRLDEDDVWNGKGGEGKGDIYLSCSIRLFRYSPWDLCTTTK